MTGVVTYGGTLPVSNLGPTALAVGDSFQLFNATTYAGAFATMNLPSLPSPLFWKNNLLVNGSLEVAAAAAILLSSGTHTQNFDTLATNGAANLWRDNCTLLGWYAAKTVAPTNVTSRLRRNFGNPNALGVLPSSGTQPDAVVAARGVGGAADVQIIGRRLA